MRRPRHSRQRLIGKRKSLNGLRTICRHRSRERWPSSPIGTAAHLSWPPATHCASKKVGELARIRGHLTLDLDRAVAVAMSPNALVNPWNGDTLGAPKTVPTDVLPEHGRHARRVLAEARRIDWTEPMTRPP
jgi:hypothetical protein